MPDAINLRVCFGSQSEGTVRHLLQESWVRDDHLGVPLSSYMGKTMNWKAPLGPENEGRRDNGRVWQSDSVAGSKIGHFSKSKRNRDLRHEN